MSASRTCVNVCFLKASCSCNASFLCLPCLSRSSVTCMLRRMRLWRLLCLPLFWIVSKQHNRHKYSTAAPTTFIYVGGNCSQIHVLGPLGRGSCLPKRTMHSSPPWDSMLWPLGNFWKGLKGSEHSGRQCQSHETTWAVLAVHEATDIL